MRHLFAVPWLTPSRPTLLGVVVLTILVFGAFALLKNTSGGRQAPASGLITGSNPKSPPCLKPPLQYSNGRFPQSSLNPTDGPRTKHGGGSRSCSVAAPATQTAVTSREARVDLSRLSASLAAARRATYPTLTPAILRP